MYAIEREETLPVRLLGRGDHVRESAADGRDRGSFAGSITIDRRTTEALT
jgi:hypothetical protein